MATILRRTVLTSIAVGASLGIVALLGVGLSDTGAKIIVTSFSITGAALLAIPAVSALEEGRLGQLPLAGVICAVVGFAWVIVSVWAETSTDFMWKAPVTLIIAATAIAAISVLDVARLRARQQWVLQGARLATGVVALMLSVGIWSELNNDIYWRAFGIAAVLLAAFLAAVPMLHRSGWTEGVTTSFCPMCGGAHQAPLAADTDCPACGSRYRVTA